MIFQNYDKYSFGANLSIFLVDHIVEHSSMNFEDMKSAKGGSIMATKQDIVLCLVYFKD